jgi:hypothetical protein
MATHKTGRLSSKTISQISNKIVQVLLQQERNPTSQIGINKPTFKKFCREMSRKTGIDIVIVEKKLQPCVHFPDVARKLYAKIK